MYNNFRKCIYNKKCIKTTPFLKNSLGMSSYSLRKLIKLDCFRVGSVEFCGLSNTWRRIFNAIGRA